MHPTLFEMHDFVHGARVAEMARGLQAGHLPTIWSENFGYGYGMPLFEFYAPLPYAVGAWVLLLGLPVAFVVKLLFFIANAGTALGSYFLGKRLWGRGAGVLVAVLTTLAPYRALNLYVRGALSESWGMLFGVLVLLGIVLVVQKVHRSWIFLVLVCLGLFLSHNLSIILFAPFAAGLVVVLLSREYGKRWAEWLRASVAMAAAVAVAAGCAAFYLLPMSLEKDFTQVETAITQNYFDYHVHFVYPKQFVIPGWGYGGSSYGLDDDISFYLGAAVILGVVFAGVALYTRARQLQSSWLSWRQKDWQEVLTHLWVPLSLFVLAGTALWMTTYLSELVWDSISAFRFIQFPWRFLSVAAVLLPVAIAASLTQLRSRTVRLSIVTILCCVTLLQARYFQPQGYLESSDKYFFDSAERIAAEMSPVLPDYLPPAFDETQPVATAAAYLRDGSQEGVVVQQSSVAQTVITTNFAEPTTVVFARTAFPGWQATTNQSDLELEVTETGIISAVIPSGEQQVMLSLEQTPLRKLAIQITIGAIILLVTTVGWLEIRYYERTH